MPIASLHGLQMFYEEHGQPEGPALLLLHGFSGIGRLWGDHLRCL